MRLRRDLKKANEVGVDGLMDVHGMGERPTESVGSSIDAGVSCGGRRRESCRLRNFLCLLCG